MFTDFESSAKILGFQLKKTGGCAMPHQTDITERQANSTEPLTPADRSTLSALYSRGKPNDVGRAFAQVCAGQTTTDQAAVTCLKGLNLLDAKTGKLTDLGSRLHGHIS